MTEYHPRHGVGVGGVCGGTPGRGSAILTPWRRGPSRAAGAWRCTRLVSWVLSDFLSSGVWAHLKYWQGRGVGGLQEGGGQEC